MADLESSSTFSGAQTAAPTAPCTAPLADCEGRIAPGEIIDGRFRIERYLASGGMGDIYEATHTYMKRRVALKLIQAGFASDPELAARFQREAELVSLLESPNVVRVFDFGRTGTSFYLAMELIDGVALDQILLREGALTPGRAVPLLLQVGDAVAEAHARSIVHRDLKPANVLVMQRPDGTDLAKVLDFGIARMIGPQPGTHPLTHPGLVIGTPAYMAPEVAAGQTDIDARADLYSFGAMAFELLTGRPPFAAASLQELLAKQVSQPAPDPGELRPELCAFPALCEVVLTALAKERDRRFPDMRTLQAALRQALREPVRPRAPIASASRAAERTRSEVPTAPHCPAAAGRPAGSPAPAGLGWAPSVLGFGAGAPSFKARPAPAAAPPSASTGAQRQQKAERDDSRVRALAAHLESLVPLVSRGDAATLLAERLKGFGRRSGVVLAVELKIPTAGADGLDARDLQQETRRCLAAVVGAAFTYGLALDWLDACSAILLLDGGNLASLGQRAARAALALREAVQSECRPGGPMGVRLALAAGAYAMPTDAGPSAGMGVETARRLLAAAPEEAIVIEEALARAAGPTLPTSSASIAGAALVERPSATFVSVLAAPLGRDAELRELESMLGREAPLARRAALVLGGPGSGKTWLMDELVARVHKRGERVAFVRDLRSAELPPPLAGPGALLAGLCEVGEAELARALPGALQSAGLSRATIAAALSLAGLSEPPRVQPTPGEACHVLLALAQASAGERGVLFVFDDLDCAQAPTQALFAALSEQLPPRFAAVATARSPLASLANVRRLPLEGLARPAAVELLKALLGTQPPAPLVDFVLRQAGGVPESIADWVHLLSQRGFLVRGPGGCTFSPPPRTLDAAARIAARVEVLDPTARRCLEAACLLGPAFDAQLVEQALGLQSSTEAWEPLKSAALLREREGRLSLASRRHRAAIQARCADTAAELHASLAQALKASGPQPSQLSRRIARHLALSGSLAEALELGREQASAAIEARELRTAALLLWDCAGALERARPAAALGAEAATQRVQHLSRATSLALASADLALANAIAAPLESEGHSDGVEPMSGFERLLVLSRLKLCRGDVASASKLLAWIPQAHPAAARHPMVLAEQAELHVATGSPSLAVELFREAALRAESVAGLARWHGEIDLGARMEARLGDVLFLQGEADAARAAYGRALVGFQAARFPLAEARVLASLGALTAQAGHLADAARLFEGALAIAEARGDLAFQAQAQLRIAQARWQLGEQQSARSLARIARELAGKIRWDEGVQFADAIVQGS